MIPSSPQLRLRGASARFARIVPGLSLGLAPGIVALAWLVFAQAAGAAADCAPWSGEPTPLPQTHHADTVAARWASLRAAELDALARRLEEQGGSLAHSLWSHVACLDPDRPGLAEALARSRPVRVHRPVLIPAQAGPPGPRAGSVAAASAVLGRPIASIGLAAPRPAPLPAVSEAGVGSLAATERALREARFEEALLHAARARAALAGAEPRTRAQLEVLAATAALALGREDEARASARRALDADPELELGAHSPKVRRFFERVQAGTEQPS